MNSNKQHIFLSFSQSDERFAEQLYNDLWRENVHVWKFDMRNQVGDNWRQKIEQAIRESAGIIPIFTPNFLNSKYCPIELNIALQLGIPSFPIVATPIRTEALPASWRSTIFIDFQKATYAHNVKTLINSIKGQRAYVPVPTCKVYVRRKSAVGGSANPFDVNCDHATKVKVGNGQTVVFEVEPGEHILKVEYSIYHTRKGPNDWDSISEGKSDPIRAHFELNGTYTFECGYEGGLGDWIRSEKRLFIRPAKFTPYL